MELDTAATGSVQNSEITVNTYLLVFREIPLDYIKRHEALAVLMQPVLAELLVGDSLCGEEQDREANAIGLKTSVISGNRVRHRSKWGRRMADLSRTLQLYRVSKAEGIGLTATAAATVLICSGKRCVRAFSARHRMMFAGKTGVWMCPLYMDFQSPISTARTHA